MKITAVIQAKALERYPTPASLGCVLMINEGYVFAGVPESFHDKDERVPVYNLNELVGYVTYYRREREDGTVTVTVTVEDVENFQGPILTTAARKAGAL